MMLRSLSLSLLFALTTPLIALAQMPAVYVQNATSGIGAEFSVNVFAGSDFHSVGAIDLALAYDKQVIQAVRASSAFAKTYQHIDLQNGIMQTFQAIPKGVSINAASPIVTAVFKVLPTAELGASGEITILPDQNGNFDFLAKTAQLPVKSLPYTPKNGRFSVGDFSPPSIQVSPAEQNIEIGELALFTVNAHSPNGDRLRIQQDPPIGFFVSVAQAGPKFSAVYDVIGSESLVGGNTITLSVLDERNPPLLASQKIVVNVASPRRFDEVMISQGFGGRGNINVRNIDPTRGQPNTIIRSFRGAGEFFLNVIGGGAGRSTYTASGDVNGDGRPDAIITFGPLRERAAFPNIVVPKDARTKKVIGHSFSAFPATGDSSAVYQTGEAPATVGNFTGNAPAQIAVVQGISGNGIVRLFQLTSNVPPASWRVVGQFNALPDSVQFNNTNGGVTLSSGDLDNDGRDELIVGQTNSPTSQTIFHVLDIAENGTIEARHPYAGFPPKFRGNGGVRAVVADLNGDGQREIIAASMGNDKQHGDERDNAPLNLVSIIFPTIENNTITGFSRAENSVLSVFDDKVNPSGSISIAAGELNGNVEDGDEIVVGTGSMFTINGFVVEPALPAPQAAYRIIKIALDGRTVRSFAPVLGPPNGIKAFLDGDNPISGEIFISTGDYD